MIGRRLCVSYVDMVIGLLIGVYFVIAVIVTLEEVIKH